MTRAERIENELRALLPTALFLAEEAGENRQDTAIRITKVALNAVRPHLRSDFNHHYDAALKILRGGLEAMVPVPGRGSIGVNPDALRIVLDTIDPPKES